MWLLAALWHKIIAPAFYTAETEVEHEGTVIIFIAYLIPALMMSYLFPLYCKHKPSVIEGLKFGAFIGLYGSSRMNSPWPAHMMNHCPMYSKMRYGIWQNRGVGGIVIALVYRKQTVFFTSPGTERRR